MKPQVDVRGPAELLAELRRELEWRGDVGAWHLDGEFHERYAVAHPKAKTPPLVFHLISGPLPPARVWLMWREGSAYVPNIVPSGERQSLTDQEYCAILRLFVAEVIRTTRAGRSLLVEGLEAE